MRCSSALPLVRLTKGLFTLELKCALDAHSIWIRTFTHDARWFRCALAFDPVSRVDHVGNYPRGCVMLKRGLAGANSTQRVGLVERSLLLSHSLFRRSRAQLNNKRNGEHSECVNVGHFATRSSCVTISTYDAHCPRISKASVNMIDAHSLRFRFASTCAF